VLNAERPVCPVVLSLVYAMNVMNRSMVTSVSTNVRETVCIRHVTSQQVPVRDVRTGFMVTFVRTNVQQIVSTLHVTRQKGRVIPVLMVTMEKNVICL
jgi:hypothetical protein